MPSLRSLWDARQPSVGAWCAIPSSFSVELLGRCGFDWVCVDSQHGFTEGDGVLCMLQALTSTDTPAFVRVPWNRPSAIMKALDAGAQGVIIPLVNSRADAEKAVAACRYPPEGYRSWGPTRAALLSPDYSPQSANRKVICVLMIETMEAVGNLSDILEVPGIDALFVGPNDLALSSGLPPTYRAEEPWHRRSFDMVLDACASRGVVPGISCGSVEMADYWSRAGFKMLAVGADWALLRNAAAATLASVRQVLAVDGQHGDAPLS